MIIRLFIIIGVILAFHLSTDYYLYQVVKSTYRGTTFFQYFKAIMFAFSAITLIALIGTVISIGSGAGNRTFLVNLLLGIGFAYLVGKLLIVGFFLLTEVVRLVEWGINSLSETKESDPGRRKFLINTALIAGTIPTISLLYGVIANKYNYRVRNLSLRFPDLPPSFDGYKIVQISDIHSGSFDNAHAVAKGIDLINEQDADIVLFTGDLVNDHPNEIDPYIDIFKRIRAKDGVKSTSGNHDYHFLMNRVSNDTYELLESKHKQMGYDMLNNEHRRIERNGESIVIAGIENWGLPPFPQLGDMNKAFEGIKDDDFTVLMSHDPSHWDAEVRAHPKQVHLTLSGHTHGMQFGVDLPGFKWSPVKWKYPRWADLYQEGSQYLYVNRGFGFIGYPGRVGVLPEITVIELKKEG